MAPDLVGLIPISFMSRVEFSVINAVTIKKEAEEISLGTNTSFPFKSSPPFIVTVVPFSSMFAPKYFNILSVWSLDLYGSVICEIPLACNAFNRIADLTCALATGVE